MSHSSFSFSFPARRSLRLEEELIEQHKYKKNLAFQRIKSYTLKQELSRSMMNMMQPVMCQDFLVQNAIYCGDLEAIKQLLPKGSNTNLIIESRGEELRWESKKFGLWSLTYEQELTTPLHITAGRGYVDCLKYLLMRGSDVELAPGGKTALHEACLNAREECAKLLLMYGANPNSVTEDGYTPLHLCTTPESLQCATLLLQFGATVNGSCLQDDETPLHVAASCGLEEHVDLYLRNGASIEKQNDEGQTPLHSACSEPHGTQEMQRYFNICQKLVSAGASIFTANQDMQTPLHMACKTVNPNIVDLLLQHGALVNKMSYGSETPLHIILKLACFNLDHCPEHIVRSLVNYGAIRVWPGALPKVLHHCCQSPRIIEVLINTYDRVKITDTWKEAVVPEILQKHQGFYDSLFALANKPRSLQHLVRCKLRVILEGQIPLAVPKLGLPTYLQNYLLLTFQDYVH